MRPLGVVDAGPMGDSDTNMADAEEQSKHMAVAAQDHTQVALAGDCKQSPASQWIDPKKIDRPHGSRWQGQLPDQKIPWQVSCTTAVRIASASAASALPRLTQGLT